jgi:hypothetical protein
MANVWGAVLMIFLIAHALVGILMFAGSPEKPTPSWPSSKSWLLQSLQVSQNSQRTIAVLLMVVAAVALIGGALGVVGVPGIVNAWPWLIVTGALVSALTLVLYFSLWWLGGIAINVGLVVAITVFKWPTNEILGI